MTKELQIRELTNCINYFWPVAARVQVLKELREEIKTSSEHFEILKRACDTYGLNHQSMIACEEMSELIKELSKAYRGADNYDHISEEIADVEIMLEQLKIFYNCSDDVDSWKDYKLTRLEERMNDEH